MTAHALARFFLRAGLVLLAWVALTALVQP